MYKNPKPSHKKPNVFQMVAIGIICLLALFVILELTNVTHILHKKKPITSASAYTKGEPANAVSVGQKTTPTSSSTTSSTQPGDTKSDAGGGDTTAALLTPTGDFVSNHHPNLGGTPAPNTESSVCTTTPGASCTITFTKDGLTKSLTSQVTDRGGSAYWSWKLQDLGLTVGQWRVEAIATQGGKTVSAVDAMELAVEQ